MTTTNKSTNAQARPCQSTSNADLTRLDMSLVTLQGRARGMRGFLPPLPMVTQPQNGAKVDLFSVLDEALTIADAQFGSDDGEDSVRGESFISLSPPQ